jgi:hypothetical protein
MIYFAAFHAIPSSKIYAAPWNTSMDGPVLFLHFFQRAEEKNQLTKKLTPNGDRKPALQHGAVELYPAPGYRHKTPRKKSR